MNKSKAELIDKMAVAIRSADNTYFNENYTKQAKAAFHALEKAGFTIIPTKYPKDTWEQAANEIKTGQVKPAEHVKNVYETVLKIVGV